MLTGYKYLYAIRNKPVIVVHHKKMLDRISVLLGDLYQRKMMSKLGKPGQQDRALVTLQGSAVVERCVSTTPVQFKKLYTTWSQNNIPGTYLYRWQHKCQSFTTSSGSRYTHITWSEQLLLGIQ